MIRSATNIVARSVVGATQDHVRQVGELEVGTRVVGTGRAQVLVSHLQAQSACVPVIEAPGIAVELQQRQHLRMAHRDAGQVAQRMLLG